MNEVSWNARWNTRYGALIAVTATSERRSRISKWTTPAAARTRTIDPSTTESQGSMNVRTSAKATARTDGLV